MPRAVPVLLLLAAGSARAQFGDVACAPCFEAPVVVPPDGATGVPTNVVLHVIGGPTEPLPLKLSGPDEPLLDVTTVRMGSSFAVRARPRTPLQPNEFYRLSLPVTVVDKGTDDAGTVVSFRTGAGPDETPPAFAGVEAIAWDEVEGVCSGTAAFHVEMGEASDDVAKKQVVVYAYSAPEAGQQDFRAPTAVVPFATTVRLGTAGCSSTMVVASGTRHFMVLAVLDWAGNETRAAEWWADAATVSRLGCATGGPGSGVAWALLGLLAVMRARRW